MIDAQQATGGLLQTAGWNNFPMTGWTAEYLRTDEPESIDVQVRTDALNYRPTTEGDISRLK